MQEWSWHIYCHCRSSTWSMLTYLAAHHKEILSKTAQIEQEIFIEESDGFIIEQCSDYCGPQQQNVMAASGKMESLARL